MPGKVTPDRTKIAQPGRPHHGGMHVGFMSKEQLEQYIWSLENARGRAMTQADRADWELNLMRYVGEYARRYGLDPLKEWRRWAKRVR